MNTKTLELLLANYKAIYSQMKLPCAEKERFEILIAIKTLDAEVVAVG